MDVQLVESRGGSWQALYIDGTCVLQGPVLDAQEVCDALQDAGAVEFNESRAPLPGSGRFPTQLEDVHELELE